MNIALIGYGYWGPNLAKNINRIQTATLYGIAEKSEEKLQKARLEYGNRIKYTKEYMDFVRDPSVEAIAIATPTEYSFQIAMDALEANKHIFIEKPIAVNTERAILIWEKAKEKKRIVHCDHIMLYHPVIKYIKKMLDNDELGDLLYVDISRTNLGPIRRDINALLDLAVHDIAVLDYISGGCEYDNLSVMGETCYGKQETLTFLNIKYPRFISSIKSSWISPVKERKMTVVGTKKMVIFDDVAMVDKLIIYDKGIEVKEGDAYGTYEVQTRIGDVCMPYIPQEDALKNSIEHFIYSAINKKESLSGPESAIRVMKILDDAMGQLKNKR